MEEVTPAKPFEVELACSKCGRTAVTASLRRGSGRWEFAYSGICAGNGSGDEVTEKRAAALTVAFAPPWTYERLHQMADLYDAAGMCRSCELVFCFKHWQPVTAGWGTCPHGHEQGLDPHWSPDD